MVTVTCIVYIYPAKESISDPVHVWYTTWDDITAGANRVIDECMVHGENGWPPHSGGYDLLAARNIQDGKKREIPDFPLQKQDPDLEIHLEVLYGPIGVSIYGVPNYRDLYDAAGILNGGSLAGRSFESDTIRKYLTSRAPGSHNQAPDNQPKPPATRQRCRTCSAQHHCPTGDDYQCVASVEKFANSRLLEGCCKLSSYSVSQGRRLLDNSSIAQGDNATLSGLIPPETVFPLTGFGCACNCSYVSQACCGATNGIIHEPASFKLGVLESRDSTACCDHTTGIFRPKVGGENSSFC